MKRERMIVRSYQGGRRWMVICPRCGCIAPERGTFGFKRAHGWQSAIRVANDHAAWHRATDGALQHLLRRVHPNVGWAL